MQSFLFLKLLYQQTLFLYDKNVVWKYLVITLDQNFTGELKCGYRTA